MTRDTGNLWFGAALGSVMTTTIFFMVCSMSGYRDPSRVPRIEKSDYVPGHPSIARVALTPKTITIRILSRDQFDKEAGDPSYGPGHTLAFTRWMREPCEITIPEGWKIFALPAEGQATFDSERNANTIAHEMLHCERGPWHPNWNTIYSNNDK